MLKRSMPVPSERRSNNIIPVAGVALTLAFILAIASMSRSGHFDVVTTDNRAAVTAPVERSPMAVTAKVTAVPRKAVEQRPKGGANTVADANKLPAHELPAVGDLPHAASDSSSDAVAVTAKAGDSKASDNSKGDNSGAQNHVAAVSNAPPEQQEEQPEQQQQQQQQQVVTLERQDDILSYATNANPKLVPLLSDTRKVSYAVGLPDAEDGKSASLSSSSNSAKDENARQPCGDYNHPIRTRTTPSTKLCHHGGSDTIGSYVIRDGFWKDCLFLPHLLLFAYAFSNVAYGDGMPAAVDVGANVGSCSMLLASRGAHVVAFEPVPRNFRKFHQSIRLSQFHQRITLVAAAASTTAGEAEITIERSNNGNSIIIDKSIEAGVKMDKLFRPASDVEVIRLVKLDDVIELAGKPVPAKAASDGPRYHVHLLKMDCQGSEYKALLGATGLLERNAVDVIFSEVDTRIMRATNSEPGDMLRYLWKFHFSIFYTQKNASRPGGREVVQLQPADVEAFVEKCIDDPTDFTALSRDLLRNAGGAAAVERLLMVTHGELEQWLTANPPTKPQPGVSYGDRAGAHVKVASP